MEHYPKYGHINDICVIGHGLIGRGTVPLIKRHFTFDKMTIIDPHPAFEPDEAEEVQFIKIGLTKDNHKNILDKIFVNKLGFCVNVSIGVSSLCIMKYCQERQILYLDTSNEEWDGFYSNEEGDLESKCNYTLREQLLAQVRKTNLKTTSITCCGANPGMVNWLVKKALINLAEDLNFPLKNEPQNRQEWSELMMKLGVKGLHIAERDTQVTPDVRPPGEFWNTWSIDGFIAEGFYQPSQLGWGTNEKWMPPNAKKHREGCQSAIYMTKPGMNVMVQSWCPTLGPQSGFLISHDQAITISDFFTLKEGEKVIYRPTVNFAYHPCPDAYMSALECIGSGEALNVWKIKNSEIISGIDELGVLLYGHQKNAYWYGSSLDVNEARKRAPYQNATSLQVCSAVIAGMAWALEHPEQGVVECDQMDYKKCLQIVQPYNAPVKGYYTDWTPLKNKSNDLSPEAFDLDDPWQFKNVLLNK